jgi:hypothetical protein
MEREMDDQDQEAGDLADAGLASEAAAGAGDASAMDGDVSLAAVAPNTEAPAAPENVGEAGPVKKARKRKVAEDSPPVEVPETAPEGTAEPETAPEGTAEPETAPEGTAEPETAPEGTAEPETAPERTAEPETVLEAEPDPVDVRRLSGLIAHISETLHDVPNLMDRLQHVQGMKIGVEETETIPVLTVTLAGVEATATSWGVALDNWCMNARRAIAEAQAGLWGDANP